MYKERSQWKGNLGHAKYLYNRTQIVNSDRINLCIFFIPTDIIFVGYEEQSCKSGYVHNNYQ